MFHANQGYDLNSHTDLLVLPPLFLLYQIQLLFSCDIVPSNLILLVTSRAFLTVVANTTVRC